MCPRGEYASLPRKGKRRKEGGPLYRTKPAEEILKELEERIKTLAKELLEALMREERGIYLEDHPTKANCYYTRDLLTLVGPVEDLKVPRVRKGDFHPQILPYRRRASVELSQAILALYALGVSTRKISAFLERDLQGILLAPKHLPPHGSCPRTSESLAGKAVERGVLSGVSGWDIPFHSPRENGQGTGLHGFRDQA